MAYTLITPWLNQTYGIDQSNYSTQYARLAGKQFIGGTVDGNIPISLTDIPRGVSSINKRHYRYCNTDTKPR
jgi:hypothetical protein